MISSSCLKSIFQYSPETGVFIRKKSRGRFKAGSVPGYMSEHGYLRMDIDGKAYMSHKLAWLYMKGKYPNFEIDHINRNKLDNRWINLRRASRSLNNKNQGLRKDNTSGYKGVYPVRNSTKWYSQIQCDGKTYYLGMVLTKEDAARNYNKKAIELFGEFAYLNDIF